MGSENGSNSEQLYTYWGKERRHCNRMVALIFFGSLSFGTIIIEFFKEIPMVSVALAFFMFVGSTKWIFQYASWRESVRKKEANALEEKQEPPGGIMKVFLFPTFYLIIFLSLLTMAFIR